jgi:hypothetical protein
MIIRHIAASTGLDRNYLYKVARSASHRYKVFSIKKRTRGRRTISQPARELKLLQRWLVNNVFIHFPVHDAVYSYRSGIGIQDLASKHAKNNYLLRADFEDFFPSVTGRDVSRLLRQHSNLLPFPLSKQDIKIIRAIVCKHDHLTIGAPSSPIITNTVLYDFDDFWFKEARKKRVIYSRYADDLYFSTNRRKVLEEIYADLKDYLRKMKSPRLSINEAKTVFTSRKHKRLVTGLVLTSDRKVSIGRDKKRYIRSMVHRYWEGELDEKEVAYLRGFLAYTKAVEPGFLNRLKRKYGKKSISTIMKAEIVSRKE